MTLNISRNTTMALRLLAMVGFPGDNEAEHGSETASLVVISDYLAAANCCKEVSAELRNNTALMEKLPAPSQRECVETLRWVLDETKNARLVLNALAFRRTTHFLTQEGAGGPLIDDDQLSFFDGYCHSRSVVERLKIALEAVELAERNHNVSESFLAFAADLLRGIKFNPRSPASSRRNLICTSLDRIVYDMGRLTPPSRRCVSPRDVAFVLKEMVRLIPLC